MAQDGYLHEVYELQDKEEARDVYARWAETYDREIAENGYASPARTAEALAEHADKSLPVLDIGCGTGLSGEALKEAGFETIDGADFSAEMLAVAERKGVYRALVQADGADPLPFEPGAYGAIVAVGVISPAHAPPSLIDDAMALLPMGGHLGFTLNDHALADPACMGRVMELVDNCAADILVREHGPHLPKIGLESTVILLKKR